MNDPKVSTLDFTITVPVLTGKATLAVKEYSWVLSEKSLYGAGETRYGSSVELTYNDDGDDLEIVSNANQEKQNVFKDGDDKNTVALAFINASISNYLFDVTEELDKELKQYEL